MRCQKKLVLSALFASLLAFALPSRADWVVATVADAVKPYPDALQSMAQNPPGFKWSRYPSWPRAPGYVVEVRQGTTVVATQNTTRNMWLPSKAFAAGQYTWRVRPSTSNDWSDPRGFIIDAKSKTYIVPESETMRATVLAHGRSRSLPRNFTPASGWSAAARAERQPSLDKVVASVRATISVPAVDESVWTLRGLPTTSAAAAQFSDISAKVGVITGQMENATLAYRLTNDTTILNEAIRRGDDLAALNPQGATGYETQDQVSRQVALVLARGVDLLWNQLDTTRRARWLASVRARMIPVYADLSGNDGRMDQFPYDSHGQEALGYLALISALSLGEFPEAEQWFDFSMRTYVHTIYVWSGPEGGYSNGTAYAQFALDSIAHLWQPLKEATGVDLYEKPWSIGFANFLMHFLPPGAPGHVFGDAHESKLYPGELKSFVSRLSTPQAGWYVRNLIGEESPLTMLLAELPLSASTVTNPTPPPNSAVYPSIGWAAMHSDITNRARTSVYFKSSPYGTFNHSHGDQNSLVIDSGGRRMLIEAGYQDYFMSPLGISWYRQTKSHNGLTFDNGVGQLINDGLNNLKRTGKITAFSTTSAVDYVEGDATPAYGTALTKYTRKVWYLRPQDAVVVLDNVSSPVARSFEWNMHGAGPMVAESATKVKITNGDRTLCISALSAYDGKLAFQTRVTPAPKAGTVESHGAFVRTPDVTGEFIVLLDINCKRPKVTFTSTSTGRVLTVGSQSIVFPK